MVGGGGVYRFGRKLGLPTTEIYQLNITEG